MNNRRRNLLALRLLASLDLYRVADGKIVEHWDEATKPAR